MAERPYEQLTNPEKEKAPIFFLYRENDLFKKHVPIMTNFLTEQGYTVNLMGFPAGTNKEEIKTWYDVHQAELQQMDILADDTTEESTGYKIRPKISLDSLMSEATEEAILGDDKPTLDLAKNNLRHVKNDKELLEKKEEYLAPLGNIYKKIISSLPVEKRKKIEFVILKGLFEGHLWPTLLEHEEFVPSNLPFEELKKETDDFAERMKAWFNEAGIQNVNIFSTGAEIPAETIKKLRENQAYIIYDRHTSTSDTGLAEEKTRAFWGKNYEDSGSIHDKSALQIPIENFYQDVNNKIGYAINSEKMEKLIINRLTQTFTNSKN